MTTLEPPRWKNGPGICEKENLPALKTIQDLQTFLAANGPSCKVEKVWQCEYCNQWHARTIAPDPAGGSSGTGRGGKGAK